MKIPQHFPVACHTDHVGPGSTFVAIKGMQTDGIKYIPLALQKGARTIVIGQYVQLDASVEELIKQQHAMPIRVQNPRRTLAELSAQALNYPANKLKIIGITGTKGKTTTSFLLEHILKNAGYKTALLTTVKNRILDTDLSTNLTTPHPDYLHVFFDVCVKAGVEYVIMEVAAQAVSLDRVYGLEFDGIIFTNFSKEHGEFYASIDDYFNAKCALLKQIKQHAPLLINADDARLRTLHGAAQTFGFEHPATFYGTMASGDGIKVALNATTFSVPNLFGTFNGYNVLAATSMALLLDCKPKQINHALQTFHRVPGRLERYRLPNGADCFIDYAHNPSSFEALFKTLRPLTDHFIVVFGAGGDRDKTKRPMMGQLAASWADLVVLTSDNPRSENPQDIILDILNGIPISLQPKIIIELDRERAINLAYQQSRSSSIIALLGKGPDEYQLVKGKKFYFCEREIIQSF